MAEQKPQWRFSADRPDPRRLERQQAANRLADCMASDAAMLASLAITPAVDTMPRLRPPHLHRQISRHGRAVWYVRKGHGPRIRIKAAFGTSEFDAEYQAAISGQGRLTPQKDAPSSGTVAWLIARYRETANWSGLSKATRRQRDNIFEHVIGAAGKEQYARVTSATLIAARDRRKETPAQARNLLDAMRGLFGWAYDAKLITVDPTIGVKNPKRKEGVGFIPWTEEHVEVYRKRWPAGTRQRVWMEVLLQTGLRRGCRDLRTAAHPHR